VTKLFKSMREKEVFALVRGAGLVANAACARQAAHFDKWKKSCFAFNIFSSVSPPPPKTDYYDSSIEISTVGKRDADDIRPDISKFEEKLRKKKNATGSINQTRSFSSQHWGTQSYRQFAMKSNASAVKSDENAVKSDESSVKNNENAKKSNESAVPSSKIGRLANYGQLAAGLALGSVGQFASQMLDPNRKNVDPKKFVMTNDNIERIVATLCKIRGAALKLGQMLSIQDDALISKEVQNIFERVRQSADFMPVWQMEKQILSALGENWREHLSDFNPKPVAAASIGQVHEGILKKNGQKVAMKVQYPGVSESIDSDIDLLMAVLKYTNIIPKGLYLEEALNVAKKELAWECDYKREAAATNKFRKALANNPDIHIPQVIPELTSNLVLTTEFVEGITVDKCIEMDQETKNNVAKIMLQLCLTELFELRFMQTDPNFANFLYNPTTQKMCLIDFGSSRSFDLEWVRNYMEVIKCAINNDKQGIIDYSVKLGFLSGYETTAFSDAHCEAVLVLGEAFRLDAPFDFGKQDTTKKIMNLVPTMLQHRLTPPPEETYSLHRKMSGAFLLCSKLNAKIQCDYMFNDLYDRYKSGEILTK